MIETIKVNVRKCDFCDTKESVFIGGQDSGSAYVEVVGCETCHRHICRNHQHKVKVDVSGLSSGGNGAYFSTVCPYCLPDLQGSLDNIFTRFRLAQPQGEVLS